MRFPVCRLLVLVLWLGCTSTGAAPSPQEPPPARTETPSSEVLPPAASSAPPPEEASVKPGINDHYFVEGGPERYERILEAERREIVARKEDIVDAMGLAPGMEVADIGAGTGVLTFDLAERVGVGGTVYAVDIVPEFLERLRARARKRNAQNVVVVKGEERATGLARASLDVALMCDTYHHIEYPRAYLHSLFETLRPGAAFVLIDMRRDPTSPWKVKHVRADKETVISEVEAAGFVFESERALLEENYYLRFTRP